MPEYRQADLAAMERTLDLFEAADGREARAVLADDGSPERLANPGRTGIVATWNRHVAQKGGLADTVRAGYRKEYRAALKDAHSAWTAERPARIDPAGARRRGWFSLALPFPAYPGYQFQVVVSASQVVIERESIRAPPGGQRPLPGRVGPGRHWRT